MKNFFSVVGLFCFVIITFIYTDKTKLVIKNMDEIMIQIKENKQIIKRPISPKLYNNKIIPGLNGQKININKSYENMKKIGYYDKSLLIYDIIKPNISIKNNYSYYILNGNNIKKQISIILLINKNVNNDFVEESLNIGKIKKIKFNYFIDGYWFEKNNDFISEINNLSHTISPLSYNNDYTNKSFIWQNSVIKTITKKDYNFCLIDKENNNILNICKQNKNYTILNNKVKNNIYINTKNNINDNNILIYEINENLIKQLPSIITYIKSKGYNIVSLYDLIKE